MSELERRPCAPSKRPCKSEATLVCRLLPGEVLRSDTLKTSMRNLVDTEFEGSGRRMARELNLTEDFFRGWLTRGQKASFRILSDFAFRVGHMPSTLFSENKPLQINRRRAVPKVPYRNNLPMIGARQEEVQEKLRAILETNRHLKSIPKVAAEVGATRSVLYNHFPTETAQIARRVKARRVREKRKRDRKRARAVCWRANELISCNMYPSNRQVLKGPDIIPSDLRRPAVISILNAIQLQFLQSIPPPSRSGHELNRIRKLRHCRHPNPKCE